MLFRLKKKITIKEEYIVQQFTKMIFINHQKYSSKVKTLHQERCGHFCGVLALIFLLLAIAMLYLAITTQFSEQKTTYYIIFALSLLSFGGITGVTIFLICSAAQKKTSQRAYELNFLTSQRMAATFNEQQVYDSQFQRDIQMQIQASLNDQLNDKRRYEQH